MESLHWIVSPSPPKAHSSFPLPLEQKVQLPVPRPKTLAWSSPSISIQPYLPSPLCLTHYASIPPDFLGLVHGGGHHDQWS